MFLKIGSGAMVFVQSLEISIKIIGVLKDCKLLLRFSLNLLRPNRLYIESQLTQKFFEKISKDF